jgi:HEAT repeat protein
VVRELLAVLCVGAAVGPAVAADPPPDALVRRLIDALKDSDPDVRQNLGTALAKIGPAAVEPLTEALGDSLPERRAGAAYALGQMGTAARPALAKLLDALDDKELDVRRQASYAVSRLVTTTPAKPPTTGGK